MWQISYYPIAEVCAQISGVVRNLPAGAFRNTHSMEPDPYILHHPISFRPLITNTKKIDLKSLIGNRMIYYHEYYQ